MTTKWLIVVGGVVVALIVVGVTAIVFSKMQLSSISTSQIHLTQEACEQATGLDCDLVMCDYIPEGKTFEEVCGKNFQKHWVPIKNQPITSNIDVTPKPTSQSNIATIAPLLGLRGQAVTAQGFAIFATTSCEFKTPQHNPPSGLGGAPCHPDSGYVVLSDKPIQQSRKLNPTKSVTTLNNTEVLVFYVPNEIVAGVQLGAFYELNGETTTYNGQPGLRYQE